MGFMSEKTQLFQLNECKCGEVETFMVHLIVWGFQGGQRHYDLVNQSNC